MKFLELLKPPPSLAAGADISALGAFQQEARRRFPAVAQQHGLKVRMSIDPLPGAARLLLICVAAGYSVRDLELLDELAPALRARTDEVIELLDISGPEHFSQLKALLPDFVFLGQTPIVVAWEAGRAHAVGGKAARDFLRSRYLGRP